MKKVLLIIAGIVAIGAIGFYGYPKLHLLSSHKVGHAVDSFNNVNVYYNGNVGNVEGRNLAKDGYNLGLKYQCVEFVKRYYYEALNHKMPNSYGHAKDFFTAGIKDGGYSKQRNLNQYTNSSSSKPKVNDLLVYSGTQWNPYGHVSIVSKVNENEIEIIQQNPGPTSSSRATYDLTHKNGKWKVENSQIIGWLRKE
jgi:surface antigen